MSYCLAPRCQKPFNPETANFCQHCGSKLLLGDRFRVLKPLSVGRGFLARDEHRPAKSACWLQRLIVPAISPQLIKEYWQQLAMRLERLGTYPQFPALLAYLELPDCCYMVQEWPIGVSLTEMISEGSFSETQVRQLLAEVLPMMQIIHAYQIIHCNIYPETLVRRTVDGQWSLIHFSLSEIADVSDGSEIYIAPEQRLGQVNFSSDLYSLGVTCLHALTGTDPNFLFDAQRHMWDWHDHVPQPISPALRHLIDRLIAVRVEQRYSSPTEVLQDLHRSLRQPKKVRPLPPPPVSQVSQSLATSTPATARNSATATPTAAATSTATPPPVPPVIPPAPVTRVQPADTPSDIPAESSPDNPSPIVAPVPVPLEIPSLGGISLNGGGSHGAPVPASPVVEVDDSEPFSPISDWIESDWVGAEAPLPETDEFGRLPDLAASEVAADLMVDVPGAGMGGAIASPSADLDLDFDHQSLPPAQDTDQTEFLAPLAPPPTDETSPPLHPDQTPAPYSSDPRINNLIDELIGELEDLEEDLDSDLDMITAVQRPWPGVDHHVIGDEVVDDVNLLGSEDEAADQLTDELADELVDFDGLDHLDNLEDLNELHELDNLLDDGLLDDESLNPASLHNPASLDSVSSAQGSDLDDALAAHSDDLVDLADLDDLEAELQGGDVGSAALADVELHLDVQVPIQESTIADYAAEGIDPALLTDAPIRLQSPQPADQPLAADSLQPGLALEPPRSPLSVGAGGQTNLYTKEAIAKLTQGLLANEQSVAVLEDLILATTEQEMLMGQLDPTLFSSSLSSAATVTGNSSPLGSVVNTFEEFPPLQLLNQIQSLQGQDSASAEIADVYRDLGNFYRDRLLAQHRDHTGNDTIHHLYLVIAIHAYQQALMWLPDDSCLWPYTLNELAYLLRQISRSSLTTEPLLYLEQAIKTYQMAVEKVHSETQANACATIYSNLGEAYGDLARHHEPQINLQRAVQAYEESLRHRSAVTDPLKYAATQNNLGTACWNLAQYETPMEHLQQAIAAYNEALQYYNPDQEPLSYAMIQNNLGTAYWNLSHYDQKTEFLTLAIAAYQVALLYRKPEDVPAAWAATQNNLGTAYLELAELSKATPDLRTNYLKGAIAGYESVLAIVEANGYSASVAINFDLLATHNNLGLAYFRMATDPQIDDPNMADHLTVALRHQLRALTGWHGEPELYNSALIDLANTIHAIRTKTDPSSSDATLAAIPTEILTSLIRV